MVTESSHSGMVSSASDCLWIHRAVHRPSESGGRGRGGVKGSGRMLRDSGRMPGGCLVHFVRMLHNSVIGTTICLLVGEEMGVSEPVDISNEPKEKGRDGMMIKKTGRVRRGDESRDPVTSLPPCFIATPWQRRIYKHLHLN